MVPDTWKKIAFLLLLQTLFNASLASPNLVRNSTAIPSHSLLPRSAKTASSKTNSPSQNPQSSQYKLRNEYNASNFFNEFDFFTASDPTHGAVQYQTKQKAFGLGLAGTKNINVPGLNGRSNIIHLAAQSGAISSSSTGRPSVRVTSHQKFTQGLFVIDLTHIPVAECGIWPAFWTTSVETWPNGGEIDIVEGVNLQMSDEVVIHTGEKCSMAADNDKMTGIPGLADCDTADGCTVKDHSSNSYGKDFNKGGGGVYAMEWTATSIKVWWWARNGIPKDISEGRPSPHGWPTPLASFNGGGCDIGKLFKDHQIVFDITFCGDWAGKQEIWNQDCAAKNGPSCGSYVMNSKDGFKESYWEILSLKVYKNG